MDQEIKNEIKELAPPRILLSPGIVTIATLCHYMDEKQRTAYLNSIYTYVDKEFKRYSKKVQEWDKTKEKLEKHKTRNIKVEKLFNK